MILSDLLRERIRARMNEITDDVATGECPDFFSYKHMTGKIEGLAEAERILLDLLDSYEDE